MTERPSAGILLYYKYVDLTGRQEELKQWFISLCERLELRGRIRVAKDGINTTVGGSRDSLHSHINAVRSHELFGDGIDFKLAASSGPASEQAASETGFRSLSVDICEEVVALHSTALCSPSQLPQAAAPHALPQEFHSIIARAEHQSSKETVLLDVRNYYETRIGHFQKDGVKLLDPRLRCFGDLTSWLDRHTAELAGRSVLMYCTGGVRCERASAYLRSKGSAFQDVVQLQGGIQRYMEAFPDGGFFKGKNFVFDERVAVGVEGGTILGSCLVCGVPHDSYEPRRRCQHCRMLVLVCPACAAEGADAGLLCELCLEKGRRADGTSFAFVQSSSPTSHQQPSAGGGQSAALSAADQNSAVDQQPDGTQLSFGSCQEAVRCEPGVSMHHSTADGLDSHSVSAMASQQQHKTGQARRLRILCLHGFRQSASSLKGRTAALARKLADLAELVYIDAPHPLPFVLKHSGTGRASGCGEDSERELQAGDVIPGEQRPLEATARPQLYSERCERNLEGDGSSSRWRPEACKSSLSRAADEYSATAAEHCAPGHAEDAQIPHSAGASAECQPQPQQRRYRRAWLLEPGQVPVSQALARGDLADAEQCITPVMDRDQHMRQTEGWQESWDALKAVMNLHGPFDGIMGFSQGAAIAAIVCASQQTSARDGQPQEHCSQDGCLRFAVCCSGYPSPVEEHRQQQKTLHSLRLPSLHIYGARDEDRQIAALESRALAEQFEITQRHIIEHSSGHVIPSNKAVVNRIRGFLTTHVHAGHACQ